MLLVKRIFPITSKSFILMSGAILTAILIEEPSLFFSSLTKAIVAFFRIWVKRYFSLEEARLLSSRCFEGNG